MKNTTVASWTATLLLLTQPALAITAQVNWIRQIGTTAEDKAIRVSADGLGGVYTAGDTWGVLNGSQAGNGDAFITKYDTSGNLSWTSQFGSSAYDGIWGLSADTLGNVFTSGWTNGSLGEPNPNPGFGDILITKHNSAGNLQWTRQIGSTGTDLSFGVSTDGQGNVYASGHTTGSLLGEANAGGYDGFLAKYDGNGNMQWSKQFGTAADELCRQVSADKQGNVYVTGYTGGALAHANAGGTDAFVVKYSAIGNLLWTRQFGTAADEQSYGISIDPLENAYVGGRTKGSLAGENTGNWDACLTKYDADGVLQWTRQFGTSAEDGIWRISTDAEGNVYAVGSTAGALFSSAPGSGYTDAFVVKYDSSGNLLWDCQLDTQSYNKDGWGISTDGQGGVYISGTTYGALNGPNAGGLDGFVVSISEVPEPSTLILLGIGALGLLAYAWRRWAVDSG